MIIDIGGGTADIAVISLGGIVHSKSLHTAGDKLNQDIISYIRDEFKILIGDRTAEGVKVAIGSVLEGASPSEASIKGIATGKTKGDYITIKGVRGFEKQVFEQYIGFSIFICA